MSMTRFPHGVSSFGTPLVGGSRFASPWATHWFVDGDSGADENEGKDPSSALLTIQKAIDLSTAQDVIYIRPKKYTNGTGFARYTEDVTQLMGGTGGSGSTSPNALKSIIGVTPNPGNAEYGGVRWKFATNYCLTNDAQGLHIENIGFFAEAAAGGYAIYTRNDGATRTQEGATGFSMYNCVIKGTGIHFYNGGDGVCLENVRFHCAYDGTVANIYVNSSGGTMRRLLIRNCEFQDGNGTAASGPYFVVAPPLTELLMRDCYFGADPTGNIYINIQGSSSTGSIANCHFACADVSTGRIVEGGVICTGIYDGGGLATAT